MAADFTSLVENACTYLASSDTLSISGTELVDASAGEMLIGDNSSSTKGEGSGTIVQTGGTLEIDAEVSLCLSALGSGAYELNGGAGTSAFSIVGGTIQVIGSSLTTDANVTLTTSSTSTLNLNGLGAAFSGTVKGTGNLEITGTGIASFDDLAITGTVTLGGGGSLTLGGEIISGVDIEFSAGSSVRDTHPYASWRCCGGEPVARHACLDIGRSAFACPLDRPEEDRHASTPAAA